MHYLETKKQILTLKLKLVDLQLEKEKLMKQQYYERVADCREEERKFKLELDAVKALLRKMLDELQIESSTAEETYRILNLLSEFNHDETENTFASIRQSFLYRLQETHENLWNERKHLQKQFNSEQVRVNTEQLRIFGNLLLQWSRMNQD